MNCFLKQMSGAFALCSCSNQKTIFTLKITMSQIEIIYEYNGIK
jgi:hypothetical protein